MMQPSNTPPDGDFVKYVERLTAGKPAPGAQAASFAPTSSAASAPGSAQSPARNGRTERPAQIPFWTHIKWAVGLWLAAQLLARFVPGAGFLFIPALATYAAWVILALRRQSPGAFLKQLGERARRAAEEAQKSQKSQPKK